MAVVVNGGMALQVNPVDFSQELKKLREAAQTFTKIDGQVVQIMLQTPAHLEPKKCYMLSALVKVSHGFFVILILISLSEVSPCCSVG